MARVVKSFSYDTLDDRDLAIKLEALEHGELSTVVRKALREHFETRRRMATIEDVYRVVARIERKLDRGVVLGTAAAGDIDVDAAEDAPGTEDAAANLAAWGK